MLLLLHQEITCMDAAKLNSLEIIFKHKEYFDQKLIDTIEQLLKTNEKLEYKIILKNTTVKHYL